MADPATPTLEDLRHVPEPAWLWDGALCRVIWANAAGLKAFRCQTLFELVDRPFDAGETGVARIAALSRSLARGQVAREELAFPSMGPGTILTCNCMIHALPDGRPGLLAVATTGSAEHEAQRLREIRAAFDLLPDAALLVDEDGAVLHLNAAALVLLRAGQRGTLEALLGDAEAAQSLLARAAAAGTVSDIRGIPARIGRRDLRVTLRRLAAAAGNRARALVLLQDITARRALEQAQPVAAETAGEDIRPRAPTGADTDAFERLGEVLKAEVRGDGKNSPAPADQDSPQRSAAPLPPSRPRRSLPHIPAVLRGPLDRRGEAILIVKDGTLIYANPAACSLLGFDSAEAAINDELLSQYFGALTQSLPPTEIPMQGGTSVTAAVQLGMVPWHGGPARRVILRPEAPRNRELRAERPVPVAVPARAEPEAEQPAPQSLPTAEIIQLPSRTPPADADDELRAILDTASDGIITLDAASRIHSFSAGAEAIFGYRIGEVAGTPFADLFTAESRRVLRDYLAALQGPGLASVFNDGREVQAVVKQGGTVPLFLTIGRLQAPKSQAAFCAVVRDITQWKKTEAELREAKEKAEATSRQKSEFLARISHELRTPLNAIMGFSEVMRLARFGEIENEKYRGYVNDIHASGSHLLSLINDLLDIAKVEAGKLELNFTAVNLGEVIDHALAMLQEQAIAARVVLRKAWAPGLPNVVADLRSMRQILLNLLSNAVKFTDPGGEIIVSGQINAAGELVLRVKDSGIGMDSEQLRNALEPFRRIATEGREAEGTGLGLPLTKALTEANRAVFAISSEPRKGTLAEITFPTTRVLAE